MNQVTAKRLISIHEDFLRDQVEELDLGIDVDYTFLAYLIEEFGRYEYDRHEETLDFLGGEVWFDLRNHRSYIYTGANHGVLDIQELKDVIRLRGGIK